MKPEKRDVEIMRGANEESGSVIDFLEKALNEERWEDAERIGSNIKEEIEECGFEMTNLIRDLIFSLSNRVICAGSLMGGGEPRAKILKSLEIMMKIFGRGGLGGEPGVTALGRASLHDDAEVVKLLLSFGANPNVNGLYTSMETGIIQAIREGSSKCLVEMLKYVKEPLKGTLSGLPPLQEACRLLRVRKSFGRELCAIKLCSIKNEIDRTGAVEEEGKLTLVSAAGSERVLRALRKSGVRSAGKGEEAHGLAQYYREWTHELSRCAHMLVSMGEDLNAIKDGNTPLIEALINGREGAAKALIEAGARLDIGKSGVLPHETAARTCSPEFAREVRAKYESLILDGDAKRNERKTKRRI